MTLGPTPRSSTGELLAFIEATCGTLGTTAAHRTARLLDSVGGDLTSIGALEDGEPWATNALERLEAARVRYWESKSEELRGAGIDIVVAGSAEYPLNLRLVHNRPPVLFVRGTLDHDADVRAIAVVGTRTASADGRAKAGIVATRLAQAGVTVVSGLADGIDTVAHQAALDAGGRTIAVFGTGIDRTYPSANRSLAERIASNGSCVSQWWPGQSGAKWTFPLRNIVTSGLSLGTVVIEASETSGARHQATEARRHGRRLFLLKHLVTHQPWAQALEGQPGVHVVERVGEIMELVRLDLDTDTFSVS